MFPPATIRRTADALLELAEAVLRPEAEQGPSPRHADHERDPQVAALTCEHVEHPHRRAARIARARRHGAPVSSFQHCIAPVAPRSGSTPSSANALR